MSTTNRKSLFVVRIALAFILIMGFSLSAVTPAGAAGTLYVVPGGLTTGSCVSWANACDLQYALGSATSGSDLWVKKGTYYPTSSTDRTISFVLKNGVALYGGFAGTETQLTQRKPSTNITILSGDIGMLNNNSDNSYRVVTGGGTNNTAILDGFHIREGNANSSPNTIGGGMFNSGSSPTLKNLTFAGNSANSGGGMSNFSGSSPTLTNVTFSGNSATSLGGGMYNSGSSPTLTNVTFNGNSADFGGGVVNAAGSNPTLTNVTFSGNSASSSGGGMSNSGSSPIFTNVTFNGNSAANFGGGMFNGSSSNPIITNSILYGDTGGEISNVSSSPVVSYSIVQGGYPGTGNLNADPLLGPLANNGGFTKTMALKNGSPAIDAGNDANCPAKDQRGVTRPQRAHCDMGAYEAPVIGTLRSTGANDGWILESTEMSGVGGTLNNTATTLNLGDDVANKQYRAILSFNTSSLPDNAVILKITLRIKKNGVVGGGDPLSIFQGFRVDIKKGTFGTSALELGDFNAAASKTYGSFSPALSGNGLYSINLSSGKGYINKTGNTQLRLRFSLDDNNNSVANFLRLYSGNAAATDRPQLIIEYYVP